MRIRHLLPSASSRAQVVGDRSFFLRNQPGDTLSTFSVPKSRYDGWFLREGKHFYRLLADLEVAGPAGRLGVASLTYTGQAAFWEYVDGTRLGWKLLPGASGLTASFSDTVTAKVVLDIRPLYSYPDFDRQYTITEEPGGILIHYCDPSMPRPLYLAVRTKGEVKLIRSWQPYQYARDSARHSPPGKLYLFTALEITSDLISFGASWNAEEARDNAIAASKQRPTPPNIGVNYTHDTLLTQVNTAKATVNQALRWLQTEDGIWAGLPWFHQVWTRDELIAALGFNRQLQLEVIERYLGLPLQDGELPTFLGAATTCSDGLGWLCLLIKEYGLEALPEEATHRLEHLLRQAHQALTAHRLKAGLVYSGHNATWMDTIGREGFPLEIQAMYSLVLEFLEALTSEPQFRSERLNFNRRIKRQYWHHGYLKDLLHDTALRPNIFLAYLVQPDLLSQDLWQTCFIKALEALGTSWGGLSSLDKHDPRFQETSSGEDNKSYHNGDSWFFINNLAGIALLRFNEHFFGKTAVELLQGSTEEILWQNMVGMPGEISSAHQLDSWGCGIQAFSGGTYLALLKELEDYSAQHEQDSLSFFWEEGQTARATTLLQ